MFGEAYIREVLSRIPISFKFVSNQFKERIGVRIEGADMKIRADLKEQIEFRRISLALFPARAFTILEARKFGN